MKIENEIIRLTFFFNLFIHLYFNIIRIILSFINFKYFNLYYIDLEFFFIIIIDIILMENTFFLFFIYEYVLYYIYINVSL
jgi:hypothetical protein